jgi:hypothetical protein
MTFCEKLERRQNSDTSNTDREAISVTAYEVLAVLLTIERAPKYNSHHILRAYIEE